MAVLSEGITEVLKVASPRLTKRQKKRREQRSRAGIAAGEITAS